MHVFVTGASGTVGKVVISKLLAKGHTVSAIERSKPFVDKLNSLGLKAMQGDLGDLAALHEGAKSADAVIHLAFDHDLAFAGQMAKACEIDRAAIQALADGLVESSSSVKLFIYTSSVLGTAKETDPDLEDPRLPRYLSSQLVESYVAKSLRSVIIRLAPVTFGDDSHPFIAGLTAKSKELGYILYPEGRFWPALDVEDAADLYVLALEADTLPNPVKLHGVGDRPVPMQEVAEALGQELSLPTRSVAVDELPKLLGVIGAIATLSAPASNEWTKEITGWRPHGKDLIQQISDWSY